MACGRRVSSHGEADHRASWTSRATSGTVACILMMVGGCSCTTDAARVSSPASATETKVGGTNTVPPSVVTGGVEEALNSGDVERLRSVLTPDLADRADEIARSATRGRTVKVDAGTFEVASSGAVATATAALSDGSQWTLTFVQIGGEWRLADTTPGVPEGSSPPGTATMGTFAT